MPETARVVFRVWKDTQECLALFPDEPWASIPAVYQCTSYQHAGQHGGADYQACIRQTRPATAEDFRPLQRELESIGYQLKIVRHR